MRMLMSVQLPNPEGNEAIKSGALGRVLEKFSATYKPEAAYFITADGERTAHLYFDLPDVSHMAPAAEPFFIELGASITWCPAMTASDVQKGLAAYLAGK